MPIDKIKKILYKIKSISHVALVHCETSSGILNPLNEISLLCKKLKKKLIVDAMSSFGGISINIKKNNIDTLVSSANKCLEGIPGFSFSIIKKNSLSKSKNNANTLSLDLYEQWKGFQKNNQWRFTPPTQAIVALSSSLNQLKNEGGIINRNKRYDSISGLITTSLPRLTIGLVLRLISNFLYKIVIYYYYHAIS